MSVGGHAHGLSKKISILFNSRSAIENKELVRCKVCHSKTVDTKLQCGHLICHDCFNTLMQIQKKRAKCHICREKISRTPDMTIFFA